MSRVTRYSDGRPVVAYVLLDEHGRSVAERNADVIFYAASTIKLAVLLAVMCAVDAGEVALDETLLCAHRFSSGVHAPDFTMAPEDADPLYPAAGSRLPISELLGMMISRSSNEATNVLVERIGLSAVADALQQRGASSSKMERRFGDVAAADAGLTNEISARDGARIMRCIVAGASTTPNSTGFMRGLLIGQEHLRIGAVVPAGIMWGSKSGDVAGIEHDVAFVGDTKASGAARSVHYLAVCTRGYDPEQGRELIQSTASALLAGRL